MINKLVEIFNEFFPFSYAPSFGFILTGSWTLNKLIDKKNLFSGLASGLDTGQMDTRHWTMET